jgi:hypothetical protein
MSTRAKLAAVLAPLEDALSRHDLTLADFLDYCSDRNTIIPIDTGDREVLPVRIEQFGKESVLTTLDGKVVGRQVAYRNHEYYFGDPPERTRGFRVTLIPDK